MGTIKEMNERVDNLSAICRKEGPESKRKEIFLKAGKYTVTDGRKRKHRSIDGSPLAQRMFKSGFYGEKK